TVTFGTTTVSVKCDKTIVSGCISSASATIVTVKSPLSLTGVQDVTVTTATGVVADDLTRQGATFNYGGQITSVSPPVVTGGTKVTVKGKGFGKTGSSVTIGGFTL